MKASKVQEIVGVGLNPKKIKILEENPYATTYVDRGYTHRMDGLSLLEQGVDI